MEDLVIVLGPSYNFHLVKEHVTDALSHINISNNHALPAFFTYGSDAIMIHKIGDIIHHEGADEVIETMKNPKEGDNLMKTLDLAYTELIKSNRDAAIKSIWISISVDISEQEDFIKKMNKWKKSGVKVRLFIEDHVDHELIKDAVDEVVEIETNVVKPTTGEIR